MKYLIVTFNRHKKILLSLFILASLVSIVSYNVTIYFGEDSVDYLENHIAPAFRGSVESTDSWVHMTSQLIIHNFTAMFLLFLSGLIPILIHPVLYLCLNFSLIGFVLAASSLANKGDVLEILVFHILPHGIFELTALFVATSISLKLSRQCLQRIVKKDISLSVEFFKAAKVFFTVCTPLIVVAGCIEGYLIVSH